MNAISPEVNLLVVDNVAQDSSALDGLLSLPGLRLLKADSGAKARQVLQDHEIALALLAAKLPNIDGFALAELMRGAERTRHTPIIFLTASPQDQQRTFLGYEAGAVDFVQRPLVAQVLRSKVAMFVNLHVQLQHLRQQVAEVERLRSLNQIMTALLTHDLRTPLMAIALSAEIVHRRGHEQAIRQAGLRIKSSSSRMARTIDHWLNFSLVRTDIASVAPTLADLGTVCAAVVGETVDVQPEIRIETEFEGDLTGMFDADCMAQVFTNLLGTALEHADPTEPIRIRLDGSNKDRLNARISFPKVLSDALQAELFAPIRVGLNKPLLPTLGAALLIVDQGISAHGGSVVARSNPSEGTVMEFLIPRCKSAA